MNILGVLFGLVPPLLLISSAILVIVSLSPWAVAALAITAAIWAFERYLHAFPKPPDDSRIVAVEAKVAEALKAVDSLKTAVNLKHLGR